MADFFKVSTLASVPANSIFGGAPRNADVIKGAVDRLLRQIWKDSAGVFAESLARDMIVETGESAGSLIPLARATKALLQFKAGNSKINRPQLNPITGKPREGTRRSFQTGVQAGQTAFRFEFRPTRVSFEFDIPTFQFAVHETGRQNGRQTSLFDAMQRAHDKQREHVLREYRRRVPQMVSSWILTGKVEERDLGDF